MALGKLDVLAHLCESHKSFEEDRGARETATCSASNTDTTTKVLIHDKLVFFSLPLHCTSIWSQRVSALNVPHVRSLMMALRNQRRRVRAQKLTEKRQQLNEIRKVNEQPNEVRKSSDEGGHTVSDHHYWRFRLLRELSFHTQL